MRDAVGGRTLNVVEPASLLNVKVPKVGIVNLGPTVFRGIPVWHLQLKEKQTEVVNKQKVTVHVIANLWISQLDYTLRRVTASLKERAGPVTADFGMWEVFSRFNENVPIESPTGLLRRLSHGSVSHNCTALPVYPAGPSSCIEVRNTLGVDDIEAKVVRLWRLGAGTGRDRILGLHLTRLHSSLGRRSFAGRPYGIRGNSRTSRVL